jgi:hypothetical protein
MKWPAQVYQFRRGSKNSAKIAEYLADRVKADSLSLATQLKSVATIVDQLQCYNGSPFPGFAPVEAASLTLPTREALSRWPCRAGNERGRVGRRRENPH